MSKRRSAIDNNRRSSKRRKIEKNEEVNDATSEPMVAEAPPVFDMANLPLEILGNLIFKYFDFKYWLRSLTLVNKRWYQAAIQSNVDKQLFIYGSYPWEKHLHNHSFIAARYRVSTIVLMTKEISFLRLAGLLISSPKLHTFVYFNRVHSEGYSNHNQESTLKFPFIKTVLINSSLLERFPNATRVQLFDKLPKEFGTFPNVEELAIQETRDVNALLKHFPSLKVLHVHSLRDTTLKANPPNVEVRISSTYTNQNWRKYYSLNQTWDDSIYHLILDHSAQCKDTKYTASNPHQSVEYEISLLYRNEEYIFPAITNGKADIFIRYSKEPGNQFCKRLNLDSELAWYLQKKQKREVIRLLKNNSQTLCETMKAAQFVELLMIVPSTMNKYFTKNQLADMMKLKDDNGSIVYNFIRLEFEPEDLDDFINEFGPLPDDWTNEQRGGDSLVQLSGRTSQYDWIKYLINNGVKVSISSFLSNFCYHDENLREQDTYDKEEVQSIIRLIHARNAYRWSSDWLFHLDWNWIPSTYQIEVLDFLVEEFKINIKEARHVDEEHGDQGISFMNFIIENMEGFTNLEFIEHIWSTYKVNLEEMDGNDFTPLLTAILHSMSDLAIWLLEKGVSPNSPNSNLPLCRVMMDSEKDYDIYKYIDMLLLYGANINEYCVDEDNNPSITALMLAAKKQPVDIVKYLVMCGAKVDIEDYDGCNALHVAIRNGRSEVVEILAKHADVNKPNKEGLSPLHIAIESQDTPYVVRALLENGADVNQVVPKKLKTPAMMACAQSKSLMLEELLKYNVDIKARDMKGHSLVYHLVNNFNADNAFSLKKKTFLARIQHLITDDNIAFVIDEAKKIIKRAIKTSSQNTLLNNIFALGTSTQYFAEFLIDHVGFDINTQDDQGNVLLSYPMNEETFMYLMTKNPNFNIKNNEGKTPLKVLKGHNEMSVDPAR